MKHTLEQFLARNTLVFFTLFFLFGCSSGEDNAAPVVVAMGPDEVLESTLVTLTSTATDFDGFISSYRWEQLSGPVVQLSMSNGPTLTFTAPEVEIDEAVSFQLTVTDNDGGKASSAVVVTVNQSMADLHPIYQYDVIEADSEPSVFISALHIDLDPSLLKHVVFEIEPASGSSAKPFRVTTEPSSFGQYENGFKLPVYGFYSEQENQLELEFVYLDGSVSYLTASVVAGASDFPLKLEVISSVAQGAEPTFSYFYLKSFYGIVIFDIDGNQRWAANESINSQSSIFDLDHFKVFLDDEIYELAFSGHVTRTKIEQQGLSNIEAHHDIDKGKTGYLVEIDADKEDRSERIIESLLLEVDSKGTVLREWDFGTIFRNYIMADGYSPDDFVIDGVDWFHMNSAIYDPSDDSIIASSRENFVVKVDYSTGELIWIFGDESKHWYANYPSLRKLSLQSLDTKPIGQHSLSLVDGDLMLFNNGQLSFQQPENAPPGLTLDSSPGSIYRINTSELSAEIIWSYDPQIYSDVCSSIFRDDSAESGSYLVTYSSVDRLDSSEPKKPWRTILHGINEAQDLLFHFEFAQPNDFCRISWQSRPLNAVTDLSIPSAGNN